VSNIGTIIAALGGTGAIAALVTALTTYLKSKTAAEDRKRETTAAHKKMAEDMAALREDLKTITGAMQAAVSEAAALRAENAGLRGKVARLENQNDRLTVALSEKPGAEKKKD
jgi:chromosome segregation ATPase